MSDKSWGRDKVMKGNLKGWGDELKEAGGETVPWRRETGREVAGKSCWFHSGGWERASRDSSSGQITQNRTGGG